MFGMLSAVKEHVETYHMGHRHSNGCGRYRDLVFGSSVSDGGFLVGNGMF